MIEFTLSRVVLSVCGILILAAVLSPVTSLYESSEDIGYQHQCDSIAEMIDVFYDSDADEMNMSMDQILPNDTSLRLNEHTISLISERNSFDSLTAVTIYSDDADYGRNDMVKLTKNEDGVRISKITL